MVSWYWVVLAFVGGACFGVWLALPFIPPEVKRKLEKHEE